MRDLRVVVALAVVALVAGCAGRTQSVTPPIASNQGAPVPGVAGTLTFTVTVPKKVNPKTKSYVSPASKGLWLEFSGSTAPNRTFALTKNAKACTTTLKALVCTLSDSLKAGSYAAVLWLFDKPPVKGKWYNARPLSETFHAVSFRIDAGKTTTIHPIFNGIIAALTISKFPQGCNTGPFGPAAFAVAAADYDGYTIAGTYFGAITLFDNNSNVTLGTSGPDNPPPNELLSSFDTPTVAWNGNSLLPSGSATVDASSSQNTALLASAILWAGPGDVILNYTGSPQHQTVSPCATSGVTSWLWGAAGGSADGSRNSPGGYGGLVVATIPVTSGEQLTVVVGGQGGNGTPSSQAAGQGGYNGGGNGATCQYHTSVQTCIAYGGGGGGGTDLRRGGTGLSSRVVVAGGGGGGGAFAGGSGGGGGGLSGAAGTVVFDYCNGPSNPDAPGGGGTQTSGGAGGAGYNGGSFGSGGAGVGTCWLGTALEGEAAGGGGGGWYGGGGALTGAPGGGGSGYAEPAATNVFMETQFNSGAGIAEICWPQTTDCKVTLKSHHGKIAKPHRVPKAASRYSPDKT